MGRNTGTSEPHTLRGPIDRAVLITIRDEITEHEPLATAELDDFLDPRVLEIRYADGLGDAEVARLDVQWTTRDDYKFHYTDSEDVDIRWGKHPYDGDYVNAQGLEHFHPPPDASSEPSEVEDSCVRQVQAKLVTRAILKLWRAAYHSGSLAHLNAGSNPP